MALLPRMQAGAEWCGPVLVDEDVSAALAAAYPDAHALAEARVAYMRTGDWPAGVAVPAGATIFTLRTLSAAEAHAAHEAAGMEPQAWGWYQGELRREVEAAVEDVYPRAPGEPKDGAVVRPVPEDGEGPDAEAYQLRVVRWEVSRAQLVGRLSERAFALAPPEAHAALAAFTRWRTRLAVERVCRALVAASPPWEAEGPGGARFPVSWRAGIDSFGIDPDGGGLGARFALELDAHLTRLGKLGALGKAPSGPQRS